MKLIELNDARTHMATTFNTDHIVAIASVDASSRFLESRPADAVTRITTVVGVFYVTETYGVVQSMLEAAYGATYYPS